MIENTIRTFDNKQVKPLTRVVEKNFKGVSFTYEESFYLDYAIDQEEGIISGTDKKRYYTSSQVSNNLEALQKAYEKALQSN